MKESTRYKLNISVNSFIILASMINCLRVIFSNKLGIVTMSVLSFSAVVIIFVSISLVRDLKYLWKMKKTGLNFCEFCGGIGYGYKKYENHQNEKIIIRKEFNICEYCKGTGKIDWIQKARGTRN